MREIPYIIEENCSGIFRYYTVVINDKDITFKNIRPREVRRNPDFSVKSSYESMYFNKDDKLNSFHMSNLFLWGCKQL